MSTDKTSERKALAKFVEEAIEKGATTVEDVPQVDRRPPAQDPRRK
jgi:hypothetical protein